MARGREGVPGVIARELARFAHAARDAHDARWPARAAVARAAPGTHTRSAPGSTRTLIRFVGGRAPPSSSYGDLRPSRIEIFLPAMTAKRSPFMTPTSSAYAR